VLENLKSFSQGNTSTHHQKLRSTVVGSKRPLEDFDEGKELDLIS